MNWSVILNITVFIVLIAAHERKDYHGQQVIKYQLNEAHYERFLERVEKDSAFDIWREDKIGSNVQFDIRIENEEAKGRLERIAEEGNQNLKMVEIIHKDLGDDIERNFNEISTNSQLPFFNNFRTLDEINLFLENLEIEFPGFVKLTKIGESLEGRDIYGVKITSPIGSNKPQIVYNSCQHAREWIGPMTTTYIAYTLLSNYSTNATVQTLLDSFEYSIIPIVNVDGYDFTWTNDRLWRKNRRQNENCDGVDNNRNWGYEWGQTGSSGLECTETYRGTAAFSEPETAAIANYISSLSNVAAYIDFHSYGYYFVWAWGYTPEPPPQNEEMKELGEIFAAAIEQVHGTVFQTGNSNTVIYPTSGAAPDWTYGTEKIVYSYTCELRGDSFIIAPDQIVISGSEIYAGVIAMGQYLLSYY